MVAFASIVIAIDGNSEALDAVALGRRLAGPGVDLALAHVHRGPARRRATADAVFARARALLPGETPLLTVEGHDVTAALIGLVERRRADLLVIGAHERHHLHVGDHARRLVRATRCCVAVAPHGYCARAQGAVATVGIGYIDDADGRAVLDLARTLAWQLGAEVRAVTVAPPSNWEDSTSTTGRKAAAAARRLAEIPGVHGHALEGDAARALADLSREVDLLVIGSHHHGLIRRLVPGDVAERLTARARCPLVVLPAPRG